MFPLTEIEKWTPTRREVLQGTGALAVACAIGCSDSSGPTVGVPVWQTIPDQTWVIGVPVSLDLANYCTDPDSDPLTFILDLTLPQGVTLSGSVISGTPTAVFAVASFVATAEDGTP